jgi:hypothetical protein
MKMDLARSISFPRKYVQRRIEMFKEIMLQWTKIGKFFTKIFLIRTKSRVHTSLPTSLQQDSGTNRTISPLLNSRVVWPCNTQQKHRSHSRPKLCSMLSIPSTRLHSTAKYSSIRLVKSSIQHLAAHSNLIETTATTLYFPFSPPPLM